MCTHKLCLSFSYFSHRSCLVLENIASKEQDASRFLCKSFKDLYLNFECNFISAGTRSACINAASLALADAGIPMRDLVTSCSAGYLNSTPLLGNFSMCPVFNFLFKQFFFPCLMLL